MKRQSSSAGPGKYLHNYYKKLRKTFAKKKKGKQIKKKHGIYELSHELPNSLRLKILGNQEISGKSQNFKENIV